MKILVFERDHNGHRFTGVRVLLEALFELEREYEANLQITVATSNEALESQEYKHQLQCYEHLFSIRKLANLQTPSSPLKAARQKLDDWVALTGCNQYQHIFVPFGDGLVQLLALINKLPFAGKPWPRSDTACETILMRGSFAYEHVNKWTAKLAYWSTLTTRFDRIHLIDPLPYQYLKERGHGELDSVRLLPDPITPTLKTSRKQARANLGLDTDISWVGCIGRIDSRKGTDNLIHAFLEADLGKNSRLLLAGMHDERIRSLLNEVASDRIHSIDRYLDENELCDAVSALDLVALPYPDFVGSVSMVLRAAEAERACLGADTGWMNYVIPEFELGTTCNVKDINVLAKALKDSLPSARHYIASKKAKLFVEYEKTDNVRAHWTSLLRQRLNLPQHPALKPWPSDS